MSGNEMNVDRVLELIAAYGATPDGWPEEERVEAQALVAARPEAFKTALAEATALDVALANEDILEPSEHLFDQVLSAAPAPRTLKANPFRSLTAILFPQNTRWPASAALASLVMGIAGGYAYASSDIIAYDDIDSAYQAAFGYDTDVSWFDGEP